MKFRSTCFFEAPFHRYAVILAIKLISGMSRIQKVSKKNCQLSFLLKSTYKYFKKQSNCFRQSFQTDLKTSQIPLHYYKKPFSLEVLKARKAPIQKSLFA